MSAVGLPRVLCITGPTGIGMTALSIKVAQTPRLHQRTEIISADSIQLFKELNVGSSKASLRERQLVRHHMIDVFSLRERESADAALFCSLANQATRQILAQQKIPLVVGGSGFYISTFLYGFANYDKNQGNLNLQNTLSPSISTTPPASSSATPSISSFQEVSSSISHTTYSQAMTTSPFHTTYSQETPLISNNSHPNTHLNEQKDFSKWDTIGQLAYPREQHTHLKEDHVGMRMQIRKQLEELNNWDKAYVVDKLDVLFCITLIVFYGKGSMCCDRLIQKEQKSCTVSTETTTTDSHEHLK